MQLRVRASSVSGFYDCPRRWAARHMGEFLRDIGYPVRVLPSSIGAAVGSGSHAAVSNDLQHKLDHGRLGDWSEIEGAGEQELIGRIQQDGVLWDETTPNLSDAKMTVRRLVRRYREDVGSVIKPVAVERRINAQHSSGILLSGQQDVVVEDPWRLRDLKTGRNRAANFGQYGSYTMLLRSHGMPVESIIEDYLARVPLTKDQPPVKQVAYDIVACEGQANRTLASIAETTAKIHETGDIDVFAANPSSSLCSDKFCPLWGTRSCPFGRQK